MHILNTLNTLDTLKLFGIRSTPVIAFFHRSQRLVGRQPVTAATSMAAPQEKGAEGPEGPETGQHLDNVWATPVHLS